MKTRQISSYEAFVNMGRPYLPIIAKDRLCVPNFTVNGHVTGSKAKNRLCVETIVVYNRLEFTACFSTVLSCQGTRQRWLYFRSGRRVTWHALTWAQRKTVIGAWYKRWFKSGCPEHFLPPTSRILNWAHLVDMPDVWRVGATFGFARMRRNGS